MLDVHGALWKVTDKTSGDVLTIKSVATGRTWGIVNIAIIVMPRPREIEPVKEQADG
jgi:hypothetical protein